MFQSLEIILEMPPAFSLILTYTCPLHQAQDPPAYEVEVFLNPRLIKLECNDLLSLQRTMITGRETPVNQLSGSEGCYTAYIWIGGRSNERLQ